MSGSIGHRGLLLGGNLASFRSYLLGLSPAAYYPMDEASGSVMHALAGSDGSYVGSPTLGRPPILPGDAGGAMGTSNNADRAHAPRALAGGGDFTCCVAIRTTYTASQMFILDQDAGAASVNRHFLAINRTANSTVVGTPGSVCIFGHNPPGNSNQNCYAVDAGLTDGKPHLLIWGRGGGTAFVNVDGVDQLMTGGGLNGSIWGGANWGIGQSPTYAAGLFVGDIGHFACWQRTLTGNERAGLASAAGLM